MRDYERDLVIASILTNIQVEAHRFDDKIALRDFDQTNPNHQLYFNVAFIFSSMSGTPIYLDMPLFSYLKFKLTHWKWHKILRRILKDDLDGRVLDINEIMNFVRQSFQIEKGEFEKINEKVYGEWK